LIGLGVSVVGLGIAPAYAHAVAAMLVVGLIVPFANGPIQAILQATIAADYQGRVFTLMGSLAGATVPFGLLLAAPIAEMVGVRSWYVTGGLVCLAMGIGGFFVPSLVRIEEPDAGRTETPSAAPTTNRLESGE
jgi:DHA3 family macrolide efflux protein-like MFS transporter